MQDNNTTVTTDVYSIVTDKIIELLEAGTIPWRKPWGATGLPRNLLSKRPYRGINHFFLNSLDYEQNFFLTWKQVKTIGASVKRGEKGFIVVFNKMIEREIEKDGENTTQKKFFLRYYKVFNVEQCTDIPTAFIPAREERTIEPLTACEQIIEGMSDCPDIRHKKNEAYYVPKSDYINMPKMGLFGSITEYYGILFHELIHSTGHEKRIGRKEVYENPRFGTEMYSMEELTAEMGSCYLKSHTGIPMGDLDNNAAYINGWLETLKGDKRFVISAANKAQQAVEYILRIHPAKEEPDQVSLESDM